jgi:hypothetical protein
MVRLLIRVVKLLYYKSRIKKGRLIALGVVENIGVAGSRRRSWCACWKRQ